jgi:cytochrome c6
MNSLEAIVTQVTNGKGAMPSFKSQYSAAQIEDVAAYVLAQSEKLPKKLNYAAAATVQ